MANAPQSFRKVPSKSMGETANDPQKAPPIFEQGECSKQVNDGLKFDLFPPSSSAEFSFPKASEPLEILEIEDDLPEFKCKYCQKTFTNKQALGGHQNAHKLERSVGKGTKRAMAETGCLNTDLPQYPGIPSLHPCALNRYPNILNRSMINSPYYPSTPQSILHGRYRARSSFSMTQGLYASQPLARLSHADELYDSFVTPLSLVNRAGNGPHLPTEITNFNGGSNSGVSIDLSSATVSMLLFGNSIASEDTIRSNETKNQLCDSSGLDLSLKL